METLYKLRSPYEIIYAAAEEEAYWREFSEDVIGFLRVGKRFIVFADYDERGGLHISPCTQWTLPAPRNT